jgi:hypothetical protein
MSGQASTHGLRELGRTACAAAVAFAATFLIAGLFAGSADASESIGSFGVTTSTTQAGGHPDLGMSFSLESPGAPEAAQNVVVDVPEGLFGNPNAITRCTPAKFVLDECSPIAQVGIVTVHANYEEEEDKLLGTAPIYDLQPGEDQPALFAFVVPVIDIPVTMPVQVRTGSDYGLRFTVAGITQLAPLASADIVFWGFPAATVHDEQRFPKGSPGSPPGCPEAATTSCLTEATEAPVFVHPLIDNPSACTSEPLVATIEVETYQDPANPSHGETSYPPTTGCYHMTFKPVLYARPTTRETDSAAGLDLVLDAPQPLGEATTPSPIHSSVVTLPEGLTINPDAADGQTACTDAQANFGSEAPAACPDNSKIGTFSIGSPALDGRLTGSIYIGQPTPADQYRTFLIADGFGIHAKLLGALRPDPVTGSLTIFFNDLPQVPFDDFEAHLFASDRGLVATPTQCGVFEVHGDFFPWNDKLPDQRSTQLFTLDSGPGGTSCPGEKRPFTPKLVAGTSNGTAGGFSDFSLQLDREDGDQFLGDLNFNMPPGFTGSLRGITYCPETAIAHAAENPGHVEQAEPSCPASSQVGTTNVAAGPGGHPFHVEGRIYFGGPFKGAPLSLVAVTPALAGPYDYGTQVVRVALYVDPLDAHVAAVSDTVPSIIGGVPIRLRSIRVNLNRPEFIINPTNCAPTQIHSEGVGDQGTVTGFDSYFHPVNCFALGFKPRMTVRQLGGRKGTHRVANPALQFDLVTRKGDANVKSLSVTLSNAFEIDQRHLGNICSEKELAETRCAGRQRIGVATTTTPLLDQPLSGPVFAVSGSGGLPRLAFILNGQVDLLPRARTVTIKGGRLSTTVPVVPDAPIGHFRLIVFGGKHGYLANTRDLCRHVPKVRIAYAAQNGRTKSETRRVKVTCGKSSARHKRHRPRHHR